jgi:hypothetical protein
VALHDLVIGRVQMKRSRIGPASKRSRRQYTVNKRPNIEALKEQSKFYQEQLRCKLRDSHGWPETEKAMQEVLAAVAISGRTCSSDWFGAAKEAITPLIKARSECRITMINNYNTETKDAHKKARKAVQRAVKVHFKCMYPN